MSDHTLVMCFATRRWDGWVKCVESWLETQNKWHKQVVTFDQDVMPAYEFLRKSTTEPILAYPHDDVMVYEKGWDSRVLKQFGDPSVGLVGFAGALGHATANLYQVPYHLPNLARQNFMSNMRDAEKHGARFTGERDVAVLDGLALFVRREILEKAGGWPVDKPYGYFMYSEWLCCETRRQGYRIRLVGVDCEHLGGKSSGFISPKENYEQAHRYFYDHNRDVMPYRVPE